MGICIFNVYICCLSLFIFMFNNSTCKVFLVTFCIIDPANCIHHYMHFCHPTITSVNLAFLTSFHLALMTSHSDIIYNQPFCTEEGIKSEENI